MRILLCGFYVPPTKSIYAHRLRGQHSLSQTAARFETGTEAPASDDKAFPFLNARNQNNK
jgi:hypothetical protein